MREGLLQRGLRRSFRCKRHASLLIPSGLNEYTTTVNNSKAAKWTGRLNALGCPLVPPHGGQHQGQTDTGLSWVFGASTGGEGEGEAADRPAA